MVEYTTNPCASQLSDVPLARYPEGELTRIECALHRHEGLIHAIIRREGGGSLTYEEALQAGRIGLWRAILNYDPTRGAAFSTYSSIIRLSATEDSSNSFRNRRGNSYLTFGWNCDIIC